MYAIDICVQYHYVYIFMISCSWHGKFKLLPIIDDCPFIKEGVDFFVGFKKVLGETVNLSLPTEGDILNEVFPSYCCIALLLLAILSKLLVP